MKVLITGGAGFIGSHIVDLFVYNGHEVAVIDNLSTGRMENLQTRSPNDYIGPYADIVDKGFVDRIFRSFRPQIICHQAAQASLLQSQKDPAFDAKTNIIGTINLIEAAKKYKCQKFIMASTMAVFSKYISEPFETTRPDPDRPYGISKRATEMYLEASDLNWTILRYGNVYGPRQVPIGENQVIARAFSHMFKTTEFKIFGDGEQDRDFVYVEDVAEANLCALKNDAIGIFHIGSGKATSINQAIKYAFTAALSTHSNLFQDHFGFVEHGPVIEDEPPHLVVGSVRRNELVWKPKTSLTTGLKRTADWWKANEKSIHPT